MTDRKRRRGTSARSIGVALIIIYIIIIVIIFVHSRTAHAGKDTRAHAHTHTRTAGRIYRVILCARNVFILYRYTFNLVSHDIIIIIIICVFIISRPAHVANRFTSPEEEDSGGAGGECEPGLSPCAAFRARSVSYATLCSVRREAAISDRCRTRSG